MEKLEFIDENGEKTQFYVIEETRINGINYLLVSESDNEDEEAEAYILKDTSDAASEEAVYEFVEEDSELEVVGKVFSELMDDDVELKFTCDSGCVVYYTTDGKEPDIKSTLYDGTAIKLETGTTKIKAVSVNSIGVYSKVVEFEYVVEYGAPAAPDVTPASGKYSDGEKIKINNIPDKCKAYYTTDGTTPTSSSTTTKPSSRLCIAPLGQTLVQAGSSQWLHEIDR